MAATWRGGATPGKAYQFRIRASSQAGTSAWTVVRMSGTG